MLTNPTREGAPSIGPVPFFWKPPRRECSNSFTTSSRHQIVRSAF